jgi:hypothetical protein
LVYGFIGVGAMHLSASVLDVVALVSIHVDEEIQFPVTDQNGIFLQPELCIK